MQTVHNTKKILLKSYSVWLGGYAPLLWLVLVELLFWAFGLEISPVLAWIVAFILATLAIVGRIIKQKGLE